MHYCLSPPPFTPKSSFFNTSNLSLMENQTILLLFCLLFCFTTIFTEVYADGGHYHGAVKLFAFGDSYADTGNSEKSNSTSWQPPYGVTFPGRPTGRFSDGRVLTDYIASYFGIRSPVPYKWRGKIVKKSAIQNGMNFAIAGTGVFDTIINNEPNMTTQIDIFQYLLDNKVYTKSDLDSSIAFISLAGNDYAPYVLGINGTLDFPTFAKSVVNQLVKNLKRIHDLGVPKIAVTGLPPSGCLPIVTAFTSYQNCSKDLNSASKFHNQILRQTVRKLNKGSKKSTFVILDLYRAFMSAFKRKGPSKFKDPLKPCCVGVANDIFACGSVDENGVKKYVVCKNPATSFFWDIVHPSDSGWHAVYESFRSSLHKL